MKTIKINWKDKQSIIKAEREKTRLENLGYELVATDEGFLTGTLFYKRRER